MRFASILFLVPALMFGANKEMLQLQRDVGLLQEQLRTLQHAVDEKNAALTVLVQQTLDNINKANAAVASLQGALGEQTRNLSTSVSGPVAGVGTKVDQLSTDVAALRETVADLNNVLKKMQLQITDIQNSKNALPAPPPPGGATTTGGAPGTPPPGMTATGTYSNALSDLRSGKYDLAQQGFTDYLQYYGTTEYAPNAQYYLGEIAYQKNDYDTALKQFNEVLEKYPENPKTADATYMVGQTLLKMGQRNKAVQQFRDLAKKYPNRQDLVGKADAQVKELGLSSISATPAGRSTTRRRR